MLCRKKLGFVGWIMVLFIWGSAISAKGQGAFCHPFGNVIIYSNFEGGVLNVNVDTNIANLRIGVISNEAVTVNISGTYASNVAEVVYAGMNDNNLLCGNSPPNTTVNGINPANVSLFTPPSNLAAATLTDPNGNANMVCAFQCSSGFQSGCNTPAQIVDFFLNQFSGDLLYHHTQYGCWSLSAYSVSAGGNCCQGAPPFTPFDLGNDTVLCGGSQLTLSTGPLLANSVAWSTGAATPDITVTNSGTYAVTTTYGSFSYTDSIQVTVTNFSVNLGDSLWFCPGDTQVLAAFQPNATYLWSTGAVVDSIKVAQPGANWVSVNLGGCVQSDTVYLNHHSTPDPDLGPDTTLCENASATLGSIPIAGWNYAWSTGENTPQIAITVPGNYSLTVTNTEGCVGTDDLTLSPLSSPVLTLGTDTVICHGDQLLLDAGSSNNTYQWSTGSSSSTQLVTTTGTYSVVAVGPNSCQSLDSVAVHVRPPTLVEIAPTVLNPIIGETIAFSVPDTFRSYAWSWGSFVSSTHEAVVAFDGSFNTITLEVIDTLGCEGEDQQAFWLPTGVEEFSPTAPQVFPNPFSNHLDLQFPYALADGAWLQVVNLQGQSVLFRSGPLPAHLRLDLDHLPAGTYFLLWGDPETGTGRQPIVKR